MPVWSKTLINNQNSRKPPTLQGLLPWNVCCFILRGSVILQGEICLDSRNFTWRDSRLGEIFLFHFFYITNYNKAVKKNKPHMHVCTLLTTILKTKLLKLNKPVISLQSSSNTLNLASLNFTSKSSSTTTCHPFITCNIHCLMILLIFPLSSSSPFSTIRLF